ncbi:MAG: alanine racemase [Ignavibacteria bacterium]
MNIADQLQISTSEVLRPTHLEIYLQNIRTNYYVIKEHVKPAKVMAVLKANAYGHGLVRVAKLMQEINADYIGVAVLEEAILLRESGITLPIMVMGGILGNQVPLFIKHDLTITASSISKLNQINEAASLLKKKATVHLKIDTGLERIGVHYYNAERFIEEAVKLENVTIEGVYSHFASSESSDTKYTQLQIKRFNNIIDFINKNDYEIEIKHISNSGAILRHPDANYDMVRPGLILFGVYPSQSIKKTVIVKPAMDWKSRVVYFKVIKPEHPVGYGSTWQTDHNTRAVTVPVGYGDGYFRSMSHKAEVIIRGKRYPVVGSISMDQIVINIENDSAYNNDEVLLLGTDGNVSITCEELAQWAGTIPYEILTNINTRVPRIYK